MNATWPPIGSITVRLIVIAGFFLIAPSTLRAQSPANAGKIEGVMDDPSGRVSTALVQTDSDHDAAAIVTQMVELMPTSELLKGRQFDQQIIVLYVRWYLSYNLNSRD